MYTDVVHLRLPVSLGRPRPEGERRPVRRFDRRAGDEAPLNFVQKLENLGMERLTGTERERSSSSSTPTVTGPSRCTTRETLPLFGGHPSPRTHARRRPDARAVHAARARLPRYCGDRRLVPLRGSSEEVASEGGGLVRPNLHRTCARRGRGRCRVDQVAVACRPGVYEWIGGDVVNVKMFDGDDAADACSCIGSGDAGSGWAAGVGQSSGAWGGRKDAEGSLWIGMRFASAVSVSAPTCAR